MFWKTGRFEQMSELGLPTIRTMSVFYHFVMTTLLEFGKLVKMVWSPQFLFYSLVTSELGKFEGEKLTLNGTIRERVEEISEECFQTEIRGAFKKCFSFWGGFVRFRICKMRFRGDIQRRCRCQGTRRLNETKFIQIIWHIPYSLYFSLIAEHPLCSGAVGGARWWKNANCT